MVNCRQALLILTTLNLLHVFLEHSKMTERLSDRTVPYALSSKGNCAYDLIFIKLLYNCLK